MTKVKFTGFDLCRPFHYLLSMPVSKKGWSSSVIYSNKFRKYRRQKTYVNDSTSTISFGEPQDPTVINLFFKSQNRVLGLRRKVVEHI
jgi:hypothetical protein